MTKLVSSLNTVLSPAPSLERASCKKLSNIRRWLQKEVAKIVHCGLRGLHAALIGAYAPMLATRSDWQI
jgi:hypothetical protein